MKLLHKFSLAFLVSNLTAVLILFALVIWSLTTGFNNFVNSSDQQYFSRVKQQLTDFYQEHRNWQSLENNRVLWRDIFDPSAPSPRPEQRQGRGRGQRQQSPPPPKKDNNANNFTKTERRISFYDANKVPFVGRDKLEDNQWIEPIVVAGATVGWLALVPANAIKNSPANEFLKQQYKIFLLIFLAVIALAIIMALALSNQLIAPIKRLFTATNQLRSGHYDTRISEISRDELGQLSENVNDLALSLEKNQSNRYQLMSDTSHELRTPLTVVKSQLIAIQDGIFAPDEQRISLFIDEIDKLNRIVDDLYQLSSSDIGGLTYKKTEQQPLMLLSQTLSNYQSKFTRQNLTVNHNLDKYLAGEGSTRPQYWSIIDKDRILQLFSNLLENCCRYTHAGGTINIICYQSEQYLEIQIQDSAPGVDSNKHPLLFDRFYRVEPSRSREFGGSGLGLALCKQIIEAHQGSISALKSPLGGLTIKLTLPLPNSRS